MVAFAAAGAAIIGAWGVYKLGLTNNRGAVDENYRYLLSVSEMKSIGDSTSTLQTDSQLANRLVDLTDIAKRYPYNASLILKASATCDDPLLMQRMIAAVQLYADDEPSSDERPQNAIPWMQGPEWPALRMAIARDSALIHQAGELTGVEPRLIVGCLIGEQIRLFNSKREMFKQYLGPVKVLSVQSQFSYGVNGIKEKTAIAVEQHLTDTTSPFYMGKAYEHLLDFETDDHANERYRRLVDYGNHLYSYIYTACILHQSMLQWQRAGYDISDRPDVLFTLFNLGFERSKPHANPAAGGSTLNIGDHEYTFGRIGFDFYYSGELYDIFPYQRTHFATGTQALTPQQVADIQGNTTNCSRPERGHEYRKDSTATAATALLLTTPPPPPDPFGIDPDHVEPVAHTAQ